MRRNSVVQLLILLGNLGLPVRGARIWTDSGMYMYRVVLRS